MIAEGQLTPAADAELAARTGGRASIAKPKPKWKPGASEAVLRLEADYGTPCFKTKGRDATIAFAERVTFGPSAKGTVRFKFEGQGAKRCDGPGPKPEAVKAEAEKADAASSSTSVVCGWENDPAITTSPAMCITCMYVCTYT